MYYVIGSGPAGIGAALALVEKKIPVTILDTGEDLEPDRKVLIEKMSKVAPEEWLQDDIQSLKAGVASSIKGVSRKLAYGSDYPYRKPDCFEASSASNAELWSSFAKGGLTNIWGASMLPYHGRDLKDWPISVQNLEPFYKKILSWVPMAAVEDRFMEDYPLYSKPSESLNLSRQAHQWLKELLVNESALSRAGFLFGRSRLAVTVGLSDREDGIGCQYCGLCHYGCPYEVIYKTSSTLDKIKKENMVTYIDGLVVESLLEKNGKVIIEAKTRKGNEKRVFFAEKVFLGAGVVPTTQIMLASTQAYDEPVFISDSQHFILPLIRYKQTKGVDREKLFTLSQLLFRVFDESRDDYSMLLQAYTYMDFFSETLSKLFGPLLPLAQPLLPLILGRLIVLQGYLHSDVSGKIRLTLNRSVNDGPGRLVLKNVESLSTTKFIRKQNRILLQNHKYLRAFPLLFLTRKSKIGHGNHYGGTFPMKKNPKRLESDLLGRVKGWKQVHIVDSSTFPSIPPGPIVLTIMANAYRISQASTLE